MFSSLKEFFSNIFSFNFLSKINVEDSVVLSTLKNKITMLISLLFGIFIITRFFQNIFLISLFILILYAAFEFIRNNNGVILDKNKTTLLYFYILLPFIFTFEINNKFGHNFLFWFLSYIICLKFVNIYVKSIFEKEQSKIVLLLLTSVFSIFYGLIFGFILKIGIIKFVSINLLILVLNYYESVWLKNFKNELNINGTTTPILCNIDGFILSGLLINLFRIFSVL